MQMANAYRTNGVEYKNEKEGVKRDFPMTPENWDQSFLFTAACYGVFLKANANTASAKKDLPTEKALDIVEVEVRRIIAAQSFERERAERTSVYVDDALVQAIAKVHKMELGLALAAYHKNVSAVVTPDWKDSGVKKAQTAPVIAAILGRQPKIKKEYDLLTNVQASETESALEL
jgi:hypothetical protein